MDMPTICFSEISSLHFELIPENSDIYFNGEIIQKSLDRTLKVLKMAKKYNVTFIETTLSVEVLMALNSEFSDLITDKELSTFLKELKVKTDVSNLLPLIRSVIYLVKKTKNNKTLIDNFFYECKGSNFIKRVQQNCSKLSKYFKYYEENKVKYIIKNKTLYLSQMIDMRFNIDERIPLKVEGLYPLDNNFYEMMKNSILNDIDTIVVPLSPFCDYGFSEKIGDVTIISTKTYVPYYDLCFDLSKQERGNIKPACLYKEKIENGIKIRKISGVSSLNLEYEYEPLECKVCAFENLENNINLLFFLFEAKHCSFWYNFEKDLIFVSGKYQSPKNYDKISFSNFISGNYIPDKEKYSVDSSDIMSPIGSPISSPV